MVAAPVRWDEACFSIPAVRAIVSTGLATGVLCVEEQVDLWKTVPGLAVVGFPEREKVKGVAGQVAGNWEAAIVWEAGVAAEACVKAGIAKRVGPEGRELWKIVTDAVRTGGEPAPAEHRVRFYLSVVEKLGMKTDRAEFFAPAFGGGGNGKVLLCPDSDFGETFEWGLERWVELGKELLRGGNAVTVGVLEGGRELGTRLAANLGSAIPVVEVDPSAEMVGIFAGFEGVVAADGSLPHLAAHAGAKCVTLFGPGAAPLRRPLGRRNGFVKRDVECSPCYLKKCPMDLRCQKELPVERVMAVVRSVLG